MKILLVLALILLISCDDNSKLKETRGTPVLPAQKGIQNLIDSFKLEYKAVKTDSLRSILINQYNLKFFNYLSNHRIDSIKVYVDAVITKGLTVTTKFHCDNDIAFQYGLTFKKPMSKFYDSLFHFMQSLKVGSDTTINFSYMGSHRLSDPSDTSSPTLTIFAIPSFQR